MRKNKLKVQRGSQSLEIIMRDVMDGLEEVSNTAQYHDNSQSIQILSIETPETSREGNISQITNIHSINKPQPLHRSKDVVSFLLEREERKTPPLTA